MRKIIFLFLLFAFCFLFGCNYKPKYDMVNQSTSLNNSIKGDYGIIETEAGIAGVFYKYLKDPIEQVFVTSDGKIGAGTDAYYMPDNLGNAKNMGFEIDLIKYIRHFGVKANYTYTHPNLHTSQRFATEA